MAPWAHALCTNPVSSAGQGAICQPVVQRTEDNPPVTLK